MNIHSHAATLRSYADKLDQTFASGVPQVEAYAALLRESAAAMEVYKEAYEFLQGHMRRIERPSLARVCDKMIEDRIKAAAK